MFERARSPGLSRTRIEILEAADGVSNLEAVLRHPLTPPNRAHTEVPFNAGVEVTEVVELSVDTERFPLQDADRRQVGHVAELWVHRTLEELRLPDRSLQC